MGGCRMGGLRIAPTTRYGASQAAGWLFERFGFSTDAYVFMPDHVHWLCEAQRDGAGLERFVALWKQRTGFAWSKRTGRRLWQKGYYERVLRANDDSLAIAPAPLKRCPTFGTLRTSTHPRHPGS